MRSIKRLRIRSNSLSCPPRAHPPVCHLCDWTDSLADARMAFVMQVGSLAVGADRPELEMVTKVMKEGNRSVPAGGVGEIGDRLVVDASGCVCLDLAGSWSYRMATIAEVPGDRHDASLSEQLSALYGLTSCAQSVCSRECPRPKHRIQIAWW